MAEEKSSEIAQDMEEDRTDEDIVSKRVENESHTKQGVEHESGMKQGEDDVRLNLAKDYEELKSRLSIMDSKLREVRASQFT